MSKWTSLMIFAVGVAVGSAATWQCVRKKYEKIAQEEIDSVKELYSKKPSPNQRTETENVYLAAEQAREKPDISDYKAILKEYGNDEEEEKDSNRKISKFARGVTPYVISPEEFGEFEEYSKISLTYFLDGFLADDDGELVDDAEEVIGWKSLNHFGEYEPDSVFVRNDRMKCDYEILLDQRNYRDVIKTMPHRMEV